MTTIVNNPGTTSTDRDSGIGFLVGIILLAVVLFLLLYYGLPLLRGAASAGTPTVQVPGKIDVNINGGQGQPPAK